MERMAYDITKEQLIADFKVVVSDAEALLKATANHGGAELAEVRARAEESLKVVKTHFSDAQTALLVRTREAVKATDAYLHENPWIAVSVAAGFALAIGLLSGRR